MEAETVLPYEVRDTCIPYILSSFRRVGLPIHQEMVDERGEWVRRVSRCKVMVVIKESITEEVLEACSNLRMVQRYGIGVDNVDVEAASRHGVMVCNVQEVMAESVAQHAWALILGLSKRIAKADRMVREGVWRDHLMGMELWGKTLGIIGLGAIGQRIARISRAFNMRILAFDPYVTEARAQLFAATLVDLDTLLRESDVVSISVPLTKETHGLIGERELGLMKKTAYLVNTSRGKVLQEQALIRHLEEGKMAGAGLDVFEEEPLPKESPLTKMDNVILTPHIGSSTEEAFTKTADAVADNVSRFLKGEKPRWILNEAALRKLQNG